MQHDRSKIEQQLRISRLIICVAGTIILSAGFWLVVRNVWWGNQEILGEGNRHDNKNNGQITVYISRLVDTTIIFWWSRRILLLTSCFLEATSQTRWYSGQWYSRTVVSWAACAYKEIMRRLYFLLTAGSSTTVVYSTTSKYSTKY